MDLVPLDTSLVELIRKLPGHEVISRCEQLSDLTEEVRKCTDLTVSNAARLCDLLLHVINCENFTGLLSDDELSILAPLLDHLDPRGVTGRLATGEGPSPFRKTVLNLLKRDGEVAAPTIAFPSLLVTAIAVAQAVLSRENIWRLRVMFRWQLCLTHRAHTLYQECVEGADAIAKSFSSSSADPALLVELFHVLHYYHRTDDAAKFVFHALKVSGLQLAETAIFGVRTRWQTISHAQALLIATSARPPKSIPISEDHPMPKVVQPFKDGHLLYDRPIAKEKGEDAAPNSVTSGGATTLSEEEKQAQEKLTEVQPLHQDDTAIILALCANIKNTNPYHGLTKAHVHFYVDRLVVDPAPPVWVLRAMTLLIRSRIEQQRNHVQERAFLQLQEFVDQFGVAGHVPKDFKGWYRSDPDYIFHTAWPSLWALKKELSFECLDLSLAKTAMELNEEIQDWEGVVECCVKLDKRRKAESIITEMLAKDPENIQLLVALGEATREESHLWKAWELCKHSMPGPMRALAKLAIDRQQYDKVVEYFDKAVAINPLFGGDWFSLGYAAIKTGNLNRAAEAFTRVCQMSPDDCYGWANLGSVLLQQGKKREAFNAMSQALRNNRRAWQMWDNYFHVGLEIKEVTEATLAIETALSLAGRHFQLDDVALRDWTKLALSYFRGEIKGTNNELAPSPSSIPAVRFEGTKAEEALGANAAESAETVDDDDCVSWANLTSLTDGIEEPELFVRKAEERQKEADALKASEERSLERFRARIQEVLLKLTAQFVTNAQLYRTCAEIFGYLNGPKKAYEYRLSELRAAQKASWERSEDTFEEVANCLIQMSEAAQQMWASSASTSEGEAQAQPKETPAQRLYPMKNCVMLLDQALTMSQSHMEDHIKYQKLKGLSKRLKAEVQKAEATFG